MYDEVASLEKNLQELMEEYYKQEYQKEDTFVQENQLEHAEHFSWASLVTMSFLVFTKWVFAPSPANLLIRLNVLGDVS